MSQQNTSENKNLIFFFIIAFAWSWLLWLPEVLWNYKLYLAPFGPSAAALIMVYKSGGWVKIKEFLKSSLTFKFNKLWLIPIFLLMPAIVGVSLWLAVIGGEPLPQMPVLSNPWIILPAFLQIFFLGGPLAEEFGWRGYALDRLQMRYNALFSSIILGVVWGLWHLPLYFMPLQQIYQNIPFVGFVMGTIFLSILMTWIYNNTNKSVLAVMCFHTSGNLAHFIFPAAFTKMGGLYSLILNILLVVFVLIFWGTKTMVRKNK